MLPHALSRRPACGRVSGRPGPTSATSARVHTTVRRPPRRPAAVSSPGDDDAPASDGDPKVQDNLAAMLRLQIGAEEVKELVAREEEKLIASAERVRRTERVGGAGSSCGVPGRGTAQQTRRSRFPPKHMHTHTHITRRSRQRQRPWRPRRRKPGRQPWTRPWCVVVGEGRGWWWCRGCPALTLVLFLSPPNKAHATPHPPPPTPVGKHQPPGRRGGSRAGRAEGRHRGRPGGPGVVGGRHRGRPFGGPVLPGPAQGAGRWR